MTHHAQYTAASTIGNKTCALDMVFEHCMVNASTQGARWFDFGISNEDGGQVLNDGLYRFKAEFGGGGVVHEFFELNLS
jgi:lipid II:glycine glycyltransferase (peptidoglycan interpeptide bridge formation enzyme)